MSHRATVDGLRLHGLHWVARLALRVRPPLQAKALVDRVASALPIRDGADEARAAVRSLFPAGSCLSRALAVAAVVADAQVVIGVDPWSAARISAHAWIEIGPVRVDTQPLSDAPFPDELVRLSPRRTRADGTAARGPSGRDGFGAALVRRLRIGGARLRHLSRPQGRHFAEGS